MKTRQQIFEISQQSKRIYTRFSAIIKEFSTLCDKITYINTKRTFRDLTSIEGNEAEIEPPGLVFNEEYECNNEKSHFTLLLTWKMRRKTEYIFNTNKIENNEKFENFRDLAQIDTDCAET